MVVDITLLSGEKLCKTQEIDKFTSLREFLKLTGLTSCVSKVIETAINAREERPSDVSICL